jgi:hypothetical protein
VIVSKLLAGSILIGFSTLGFAGSTSVVSDTNAKSHYVGLDSATFPAVPSASLPAGWTQVQFDDSFWKATAFCAHPFWLAPTG